MKDVVTKQDATEHAKALSTLGAAKGGRARAASLTPEQLKTSGRNAVLVRWRKAGKSPSAPIVVDDGVAPGDLGDQFLPEGTLAETPRALFSGVLQLGTHEIPCHVLNDRRHVLHQRAMVPPSSRRNGPPRGRMIGVGTDRQRTYVSGCPAQGKRRAAMLQRGQRVRVKGIGGREAELIVWNSSPKGAGLCTGEGYAQLLEGLEAPVVGFPMRDIVSVVGEPQPSGA